MYTAYDMTARLSFNASVIYSQDDGRQLQKIVTARPHEWQVTDDVESLKSETCHRFSSRVYQGGVFHSTTLAETQRAICTLHIDNSTQVSTVRVVIALNVPITHLLTTY